MINRVCRAYLNITHSFTILREINLLVLHQYPSVFSSSFFQPTQKKQSEPLHDRGLFASATSYGGLFCREFSQAVGSDDLELYLPDDPVILDGVCAGSAVDWIKFHCTNSKDESALFDNPYTNDHLKENGYDVIAIQRAFRLRDLSLARGLINFGMKAHCTGYLENALMTSSEIVEFIRDMFNHSGVGVISYFLPGQGRHVACLFVDAHQTLYFSDINRGDVKIPYPLNAVWLQKYCGYFLDKCGTVNVSHFEADWNSQQEKIVMEDVYRDSQQYL